MHREDAMAVIGENGSRTIRFGIFEVDLRAGELRWNFAAPTSGSLKCI